LPESLIRGKTVVDLGSCLGAMGQWCLHHGAIHYTGIEVQEEFALHSENLLAHWGDKVEIRRQCIREYLAEQGDNSVDVVIVAGVLQVFIDPHLIIGELCRIANEAIVVEAVQPPLVREGEISEDSRIMQFFNGACNLAGDHFQMRGLSAALSKKATDLLFWTNGFRTSGHDLSPKASIDTYAYTVATPGDARPMRFFEHYISGASHIPKIKSLEASIKTKEGRVERWQDNNSLIRFSNDKNIENIASWKFDQHVANSFDTIAQKNIPDYERVLKLSIDYIKMLKIKTPRIIDVGCATGNTLQLLAKNGFKNLVGVDNSQQMLDKVSVQYAELICSDHLPVNVDPYHVVLANWTLHFIEQREEYLRSIYDALHDGGILILTEKTQASAITTSLYKQFKLDSGMTKQEIMEKEQQLQGVLVTYSADWYLMVLSSLGFQQVDVVNARLGFVTFLARK